ncbi:PSD1 and planctomycete cytochrome C domain-containing protein [Luteolibacter arcticus]|uniref:PSD1 and planctomycete cytochrome C domain-containing protein n=1 Tax=Luteolibacter arcticus TaxID=1581411 RepID=A0ABT3GS77_9BACT|nr:PSD1 and planctomycete cytochrome C domain-containing protein [Luteolibacter arcticus]MCW1926383.1 PSD1 and planctomycete cytochrome C domain-containing protein [Luteolibacter arcticus]
MPLVAHGEIRYGRDIRPILSDKCFFCHGPDPKTREEDLRLDIREEAIEAKAFVPGNPEKSRLIKFINATDEDDLMPPPESHKTLTQAEKQLLQDWIKAGAEYEPHWAYAAPNREPNQTIDSLVARDLEARKLGFSPPADPTTLLRRLHYDVIGLPPTPEQVAAFQQAHAKDPEAAIRGVVEQLLASPHFGERMAVGWLDAVRYSDTVGYHGDQERSASPYRDYVIDAFNSDKPFDQFTIEQIAGDLLPEATLSQKVAASYNRLNQLSEEGGIQDAEYLAKYQAERVRTTSAAWLGSTMACCECHDHKFDPFTAKDFYSFAAYFSDILERGACNNDGKYQEDLGKWTSQGIAFNEWGPLLPVPSAEQSARVQQVDAELGRLRQQHESRGGVDPRELDAWISKQRAMLASKAPYDAPLLDETLPNPASIDQPGFVDRAAAPVQAGTHSRKQESTGLVQHIATLKKPVTVREKDELYVWVYLDRAKPTKALMLQANVAGDWSHRAYWGDDAISYGKGGPTTAYHHAGKLPRAGGWVRLTVPAAAMGLPAGSVVGQLACTQFGGLIYWDNVGIHTSDPALRMSHLPAEAIALLQAAAPDKAKLATIYQQTTPAWQKLAGEIATLETERTNLLKSAPTVPMTISAKPREIRLLDRGDWQDKSGPIVDPAPPAFLTAAAPPATGRATRLDLARWIVRKDNPLTARVFVNRQWARLFGTGLSKDTGDLGLQGEYPVHPELLDWLAVEFMENRWSVKHVMRSILLSRTYQQASTPSPALAESDPQNRLLARQSQLRLPAELIRDNALAVSGLLNPAIGGRSAKPYQPAGYYRHLNFPEREYQADKGAQLYRRGLYTHWQRTFLHPMLKAFDAPTREECSPERTSSNTPLQALNLLNDPSFNEAARVLATRLLTEKEGENQLVARAWLRCLSRPPTAEELRILGEFHAQELARFNSTPAAAAQLLAIGELPAAKEIPPARLAAATSLARAILNLHEAITRY